MRVVFVHGACVRDGGWWWHLTGASLSERGIESSAALLPSCGEGTTVAPGWTGAGLADDAAALRALVTGGEDVVVVAHSYGGIVAAEALAGVAAVRHLLLISSYLPEPGESLSSFGSDGPAPFLDIDPDAGTFTVRPSSLAETFLQDCPPDVTAAAGEHLACQSLAVTQHPVTAAAWREVPTTYLVCAQDRGTPADAQRGFARRAARVVELDTGHHPFLSRPDAVADLIVGLQL